MNKKFLLFLAFEGVVSPSSSPSCGCKDAKAFLLDGIFHYVCPEMISFLNRISARDDIEVVWASETAHPVENLHKISNKVIPEFAALDSPRLSKTPNRILKASENFENVIVVDSRESVGVGIRSLVEDSNKFLMIRPDRRRGLCGSGHFKLLERFLDFKMVAAPVWVAETVDAPEPISEMAEILVSA